MKNEFYIAPMAEDVIIPSKEDENAGYDLYAHLDDDVSEFEILPHQTSKIGTKVAVALPEEYEIKLTDRSSVGGLGIHIAGGLIDSGYRGEIAVQLTNTSNKSFIISKLVDRVTIMVDTIYYPYSKAITQMCLHKVHNELKSNVISYEELAKIPSKRGTGGFGSTGK
jgi:deoxyuridine 5'-triphosphate nucleotidohydrolase